MKIRSFASCRIWDRLLGELAHYFWSLVNFVRETNLLIHLSEKNNPEFRCFVSQVSEILWAESSFQLMQFLNRRSRKGKVNRIKLALPSWKQHCSLTYIWVQLIILSKHFFLAKKTNLSENASNWCKNAKNNYRSFWDVLWLKSVFLRWLLCCV